MSDRKKGPQVSGWPAWWAGEVADPPEGRTHASASSFNEKWRWGWRRPTKRRRGRECRRQQTPIDSLHSNTQPAAPPHFDYTTQWAGGEITASRVWNVGNIFLQLDVTRFISFPMQLKGVKFPLSGKLPGFHWDLPPSQAAFCEEDVGFCWLNLLTQMSCQSVCSVLPFLVQCGSANQNVPNVNPEISQEKITLQPLYSATKSIT